MVGTVSHRRTPDGAPSAERRAAPSPERRAAKTFLLRSSLSARVVLVCLTNKKRGALF